MARYHDEEHRPRSRGRVCWGFTADYELVPDLEHLVERLATSFCELAVVAAVEVSAPPEHAASPRPEARLPAASEA